MDFVWAALFLLLTEVLSLPVRAALAATRAPADVRRVLSRLAGPVLLVLPIWWLGHATGSVLDRAFGIGWVIVLLLAAGWSARSARAGRLLAYDEPGARRSLRRQGALDLLMALRRQAGLDLLMALLFFGFVAFRRLVPEMTAYPIDSSAAEKFMNMMLFWSSWYAGELPPDDYWLSGHGLAYYYFGHFQWAWLGRIGGFPAELAVNLALARVVTGVFEAGYLLARAVRLPMQAAAGAGLAVAWAGNPSAVVVLWRTASSGARFDWSAYDFWQPSRAIADSVISEFPAFTAVLGDFHAHHLALPWLVALFALALAGGRWLLRSDRQRMAPIGVALALGLGLASALANLWNLAPIGLLMLLLPAWSLYRRRSWRALAAIELGFLIVLAGSLLLLLPGLPGSSGEGFPLRPLPPALRSSLPQLLSMWGLPIAVLAAAALARSLTARDSGLLALTFGSVGLVLATSASSVAALGLWAGVAGWTLCLARGPRAWLPGCAAGMLLAAVGVLAGLELVFVDDPYTGEYERYNSYFKLSFAVWPLLLVGAFTAGLRLWRLPAPQVIRTGVRAGLAALLAAAAVFPVFGAPARVLAARRGDEPARAASLDAVSFLAHRPPWSREAGMLAWIREHVPARQRVAEGLGKDSYGYVGRVASLAGRPVPLGWAHHERQWRGRDGHRLTHERQRAIDGLYLATEAGAVRRAAAALGVHWVLYGIVERARYPDALEHLTRAARVAAAFPERDPEVFLFDLREPEVQ